MLSTILIVILILLLIGRRGWLSGRLSESDVGDAEPAFKLGEFFKVNGSDQIDDG